ncbi:M20 family metallo-hydrolase [Dehalobacterium formicoaceticum]|uniref:M20 family metallo-hydrolase n=1 Tax=Dehalobacterium formicoaceticum TaxID=51515 RepID=A0ABT1Y1Q7_9FIRM|nr:M20 family metallo-hydrolase [Dehalobacterium formicoaceticum]MCR6544802.1 M20 family metallo-hydrolase [Dehalobacterium formicoaceticum]
MNIKDLTTLVESRQEQIVSDMVAMSSIPAINPQNNGTGEYERCQWILGVLKEHHVSFEVIEVADDQVQEGQRLNIIAKIPGTENKAKTLWFIAHTDTVSPGDLKAWHTDPFKPEIKDGRIYGLGVEDNGQGIISILHTCLVMQEQGIRAKCNIGFIFAADEETGSDFGLKELIRRKVFSAEDEAIVPDAGSPDGTFIEIAEKSIAWMKFTVMGKQTHGSMPHLGINAGSVGAHLAVELEDTLKELYADHDELFDPPYSTFELTQKFSNVESPNIIPGEDVFVMDMRVLPKFKLAELADHINKTIARYEYREKVRIRYEFLQKVDAPVPTAQDALVVQNLKAALAERSIQAYCGGIGGGTCAAMLRAENIPAVVWSTINELAHQPNEYTEIKNIMQDTLVFLTTISKYC